MVTASVFLLAVIYFLHNYIISWRSADSIGSGNETVVLVLGEQRVTRVTPIGPYLLV